MTTYLLRRLVQFVPMLLGIAVAAFLLIHLAPGDPIVALAGEYGDASYYAFMRAKFGLDRPIGEQLVVYLATILRGDLGTSYAYGQPVVQVILSRLPATLLLMGTALVASSLIGVALGVLAARYPYSLGDFGISTLSLTGYAIPVFWLAQMLILLLALKLDWLPVQGMTTARHRYEGLAYGLDVARHMILPVAALTIQELALITRLMRTNLLEVLDQDFIRTARAKGLPEWRVMRTHALRNALLPVVTVIGGRIGFLFAGTVLTETVFAWPGIGRLMVAAILNRDFPILMGLFIMTSVTVLVANLITDLAYAFLDPRIRYR
ncbi:MAG: ABC transporter permease [Ardenticatenaceae bacterium]|nr:ABC transporter permease [Ardenticatenaceae bacterium]HBY97215.1 ABC transporter permease [Chloroflexota bacterium]